MTFKCKFCGKEFHTIDYEAYCTLGCKVRHRVWNEGPIALESLIAPSP